MVENKTERYREKITNPEATALLEKNDSEISVRLVNFQSSLEQAEQKKQVGTLTEKDIDKIVQDNRLLSRKIIFGAEDQGFDPYDSRENMEKVIQEHRQRKISEGEKTIDEIDWDKFVQQTGEDPEMAKARIRSEALQTAEEVSAGMRHTYLDQTNGSLFAIGMNSELIGDFIKKQEIISSLAGETTEFGYKNIFTEEDFKLARNRAYYEALRTNNNVFTHVTNLDNAEKILRARSLSSTSLHSKDKTWQERQVAGQIPHEHLEKSIYMTSGGGGLWYGTKNVSQRLGGGVQRNNKESFIAFAILGKDIMAEGKSIQVASPTLHESGEAQQGQEVADLDNKEGTELPIDNTVVIVANSEQYGNMFFKLLEMGYNEEWAQDHIVELARKS